MKKIRLPSFFSPVFFTETEHNGMSKDTGISVNKNESVSALI